MDRAERTGARTVLAATCAVSVLFVVVVPGCAPDARASEIVRWAGMDTLSSGQVVIRNSAHALWEPGSEWRVVERFRIGTATGDGPDAFGRVEAFDVDRAGRIWILDSLARRVLVFDSSGSHVRTIGRRGGGPGEFGEPVDIDLAPDGNMWVVDVENNRISAFDADGRYVDARRIPTRFKMWPWWGGFDDQGRYYTPVGATPSETETVAYTLVRHDMALVPRDTLARPQDPIARDVFEYRGSIARVPFQGSLTWRLSRDGTVWALVTDEYRLFQLDWAGDTLRTIIRTARSLPVTEDDLDRLRSAWARQIQQEGEPRWWSRLPKRKPPVTGSFFVDDQGTIWVEREAETTSDRGRLFDVIDLEGRYLGVVRLPFAARRRPSPIVRDGALYGVTFDELDVPYIVKAAITKE